MLQGMLYRCRKCRRLLATQNNVVAVTEGPGSIAFKYRCIVRPCMVIFMATNSETHIPCTIKHIPISWFQVCTAAMTC